MAFAWSECGRNDRRRTRQVDGFSFFVGNIVATNVVINGHVPTRDVIVIVIDNESVDFVENPFLQMVVRSNALHNT